MAAIVLLSSTIIFLSYVWEFQVLVRVAIIAYSLGILIKIFVFFRLRLYDEALYRPYKVSGPLWWLCLMFAPAVLLSLAAICVADGKTLIAVLVLSTIGVALFYLMDTLRKHTNWFDEPVAFAKRHSSYAVVVDTDDEDDAGRGAADTDALLGDDKSR